MNENIDLTKILKGCPEGTKFYSPLFGEVEFVEVSTVFRNSIVTKLKHGDLAYFSKTGQYFAIYEDAECQLVPSKDQRDWAKFERFWDKPKVERFDPKTLQPFDKVLIKDVESCWVAAIFSHMDDSIHGAICCGDFGEQCIPYNEETKHLVGTSDDCPEFYKWWEA